MGFSAVGDNLRFKNDLEKFNLILYKGYKDHHMYTEEEILSLNNQRIQNGADYLVCTEKDFVKIRDFRFENEPLIFSKNIIKFNINF